MAIVFALVTHTLGNRVVQLGEFRSELLALVFESFAFANEAIEFCRHVFPSFRDMARSQGWGCDVRYRAEGQRKTTHIWAYMGQTVPGGRRSPVWTVSLPFVLEVGYATRLTET